MNNNILIPVIDSLQKEGMSEEQVADLFTEVMDTASGLLYAKIMEVLSDEDMQVVESFSSDEEANEFIARLYVDKTGVSLQELMNVFLKEYAATFIDKHNIENQKIIPGPLRK